MKKLLLLITLIVSTSLVYAELDFLHTAADELYGGKAKADFSTMTPLACNYSIYMSYTNTRGGFPIEDISRVFYIDDKSQKVYAEDRELVNLIRNYSDDKIQFTTSSFADKKTTTTTYTIDRYSGRIFIEGTVRHQYGAIASLTYNNLNFSGKGMCEATAKGRKF